MAGTQGKVWKAEEIKELLRTRDDAVNRGIVRIFELQTASEQDSECTHNKNGVGFGAFDAQFLSSLAKQIKEKGHPITANQMRYARPKMLKYAGQLARIANGEFNQMMEATRD